MYSTQEFIQQVQLAYNYVEDGHQKSPDRLHILQRHVATVLREMLPNMTVQAPDLQHINGHFHSKKFPIVVRQDENPVFCIGSTFTLRSYASNIYNYFQEVVGEAVNIQLDGVRYCSIWVIPTKVPRINRQGVRTYQSVSESHFMKFFRLMNTEGSFRPFAVGCFIVNIDYESNVVTAADARTVFNPENLILYNENLSMEQFFNKIGDLAN